MGNGTKRPSFFAVRKSAVDNEGLIGIHEIYLDNDNRVRAFTAEPVTPQFNSEAALKQFINRCLARMPWHLLVDINDVRQWLVALTSKPILDYESLPEGRTVPITVTSLLSGDRSMNLVLVG